MFMTHPKKRKEEMKERKKEKKKRNFYPYVLILMFLIVVCTQCLVNISGRYAGFSSLRVLQIIFINVITLTSPGVKVKKSCIYGGEGVTSENI